MTFTPPPNQTNTEKLDTLVKYLRWGWAIIAFVVMATAYAATTLADVKASIHSLDTNGSGRHQKDAEATNRKLDDISTSLNKIKGKLGID